MNRRIMFCIDSPGFGGSEINAIKLMSNLVKAFDLSLLLNPDHSGEIDSFVERNGLKAYYSFASPNLKGIFKGLSTGAKISKLSKSDVFVIWSHHLDSNRWLQLSLALSRRKFVVVEQLLPTDYRSIFRISRLTKPIKRFVVRRANAIVICGYSQLDIYKAHFGGRNCLVIPNTRDVRLISNLVKQLRAEGTAEKKSWRIISVGRLTDQKDQSTLLRAVANLSNAFDLTVELVGDGEDRLLLEELTAELNIKVSITGHISNVFSNLAASDIFVLSSKYEGLPGALLEAMAAGVPCIVSDIPGNNELIADNYSGLTFPVGSASKLSSAIEFLITNPLKVKDFIQNAFNHVLQNYDLSVEFNKWNNLLSSL